MHLEQVVLPVWRDEFGIEVTVLKTEYAGHARDLARTVDLTGYDGLCVIGGDGSGGGGEGAGGGGEGVGGGGE